MARSWKKVLAATDPLPKLGASSVGARGTVLPVVTSELPKWAAARTRTASVAGTSKSPVKPRVSVADVLPDAPPVTLETDSPAIAGLVTSAKLDADTPEAKVRPPSETVTVAPFRVASVSEEGLVAEMYAAVPKTRCAD